MKYEIKYQELTNYLKILSESDFQNHWNENKNPLIKEFDENATPGTPFLVDAIGNDLSILIHTKRKYKLPTGRVVNAKFDRTLITDCRKTYGTPLNGCWHIPETFLKQIN
jgi:hypothetical protein